MKRTVPYLVLLPALLIILLTGCQQKRPLILAEKGNPSFVIFVSEEEGPVTRFAAQEMAGYLGQITRADFHVTHDPESPGQKIVVGCHNALAREIAGDTSALTGDGFMIRQKDGNLFIYGAMERGTLYGVYYFLDHYLGIRWYAPGFTVVPEKEKLVVELPVTDRQTPRFLYREVFDGQDDGYFRQHNLLNGNRFHRQRLHYDKGINSWATLVPGGAPPRFGGHNFYEVVAGEICHNGGQLLAMEPSCRHQAIEYFLRIIPQYGTDIWYGFTQRDNGWNADTHSIAYAKEHGGSLSAPILDMVTDVGEKVREKIPGAKFATYAYQFSFKPPEKMKVPSWLLVETAPIHADFGRAFGDPRNAGIDSALRQWDRISSTLGIWTYNANFQNYLQPLPNIYPMCEDIQYLAALDHFKEYFGQGSYSTAGGEFTELRTWVLSRLLWNPQQDYKQLIREFAEGYYGPAAPYILEYIDLMHRSLKKHGDRISSKQRITSDYLDLDFILAADALMEQACRATERTEYAPQTHRVCIGVDMTLLLREAGYRHEAEQRGIPWKKDPDRLSRLQEYIREAGITAYNEDTPIAGLFEALKIRRTAPASPDTLVAGRRWIDFQDLDFNICCGAVLTEDDLASDHGAVRYSGEEWAIQMKLDLLPPEGEWELWAGVRCEPLAGSDPQAVAFHMGTDPGGQIAPRIDQVDDGQYHLFKFPSMPVHYQTGRSLWFSTGKNLKHLYVDRIIAIKVK